MRNLTSLALAAALTGLLAPTAEASDDNSGPSSKAAFAYGDISIVKDYGAIQAIYHPAPGYGGSCDNPTQSEIDTGSCLLDTRELAKIEDPILRTTIKTPKHKDLAIDVSLECGNFAKFTLKNGVAKLNRFNGSSSVRVAVLITDENGDSFLAKPNYGANNPGVVFCHSDTDTIATFAGIFDHEEPYQAVQVLVDRAGAVDKDGNQIADGDLHEWIPPQLCDKGANPDPLVTEDDDECGTIEKTVVGTCLLQSENGGIVADTECLESEQLDMIRKRVSANSFNFFYPNVASSGLHTIEVFAWVDNEIKRGGGTVGATIGLGSMFVETVRTVKADYGDHHDNEDDDHGNQGCDLKKEHGKVNNPHCDSVESLD